MDGVVVSGHCYVWSVSRDVGHSIAPWAPFAIIVTMLFKQLVVGRCGHLFAPERREVLAPHLGVEECEAPGLAVEDGAGEADLAGVAAAEVGAAEHGLAAEDAADAEAVEPADERAAIGVIEVDGVFRCRRGWVFVGPALPRFDRMGQARVVECLEDGDDVAVDPRPVASGVGAGPDDAGEGGVGGDLEAAGPHGLPEAAADVEAGGGEADHAAGVGLVPHGRGVMRSGAGRLGGHEEGTLAIAVEHGGEVGGECLMERVGHPGTVCPDWRPSGGLGSGLGEGASGAEWGRWSCVRHADLRNWR